MTDKSPKIKSLNPVVMPDNRRVMMELVVDNLPSIFSNVVFTMPDLSDTPPAQPPKPHTSGPSPYPNIELSILNRQGREVASIFIVEHKEQFTSLTLHLRAPDTAEQYVARAEMTHADRVLEVVEVPFTLNQAT